MKACLLAIGSELLRFGRQDTNGDWLSARLAERGVEVVQRTIVGDDVGTIASAVAAAIPACDLLILTGGLGPTGDDLTRESLARGLGVPLERDPARVEVLKRWFETRGREFHEAQSLQADRPRGSEWIDNPLGSAPGIRVEHQGTRIISVPGVPAEMKHMFEHAVVPELEAGTQLTIARESLAIGGRPEAAVEQRVSDLYAGSGVEVTILSGYEGVELHFQSAGESESLTRERVAALKRAIAMRLGADVYGQAEDRLAVVVGRSLTAQKATLATAESCTAGLLAATLTESGGASAWYRGGIVAYHNDVKLELLGVRRGLIEAHGAVSAAVARAMAEAARERGRSTYGIGVTGVAGPGGGTPDKPVGRIYLALASDHGVQGWTSLMLGDRSMIRRRTVTWALDTLRRQLL